MKHWAAYFIPGFIMVLAGFWMGASENLFFALTGFLSCFVIGVTLIVEGRKKIKAQGKG